jgi:hypothetical protein
MPVEKVDRELEFPLVEANEAPIASKQAESAFPPNPVADVIP